MTYLDWRFLYYCAAQVLTQVGLVLVTTFVCLNMFELFGPGKALGLCIPIVWFQLGLSGVLSDHLLEKYKRAPAPSTED